ALLVAIIAGCADPPCTSRGTTRSFNGTAQFTVSDSSESADSADAGTPARVETGTLPLLLLMDDFDPYQDSCAADDARFTMNIGRGDGCRVWMHATAALHESSKGGGAFVSAAAEIEAGQRCTLATSEGPGTTFTLTVTSGLLTLTPGSAELTIAG